MPGTGKQRGYQFSQREARGVMAKVQDSGLEVIEFELQPSYYVHKYSWESYEPHHTPAMS